MFAVVEDYYFLRCIIIPAAPGVFHCTAYILGRYQFQLRQKKDFEDIHFLKSG